LSATGFPSGVRGTPVEIVESSSPLVIHQKELLQDSGGSGKFRGGLGQVISFGTRSDKPFRFPTMFDREKNPANGLAGGNPGAKAVTLLNNNSILKSKRLYHLNREIGRASCRERI